MSNTIRVRFAPSPTGPLHIGGIRTALFNYLFAKKNGGTCILRIEDTDQNRYVEGAEQYIIDALNWCGIPFDEGPGKEGDFGPYRQSERKQLYKKYADELVLSGNAYFAFDSPEILHSERKKLEADGKTFIYNWHNRLQLTNSLSLSEKETQDLLEAGTPYVIRFKSPENQQLRLTDSIRGNITIDTNVLDDKVLFKSDGMPTYHLANIVDDHLMEISHVIRGEEWLPSLALHQQLYDAFGWKAPEFAHLPLIMKPVGKGKLSKRDGEKLGFPVFPLSWNDAIGYREAGFFPEAVINFLSLLGWNPGTEQEFFTLAELVDSFTLERVTKAGARFDPDKTKWYNQHYLQQKSNAELVPLFKADLAGRALHFDYGDPYYETVISLIKERATFVSDFWALSDYFFVAPGSFDEKAVKKQWKADTPEILGQVADLLHSIGVFTSENVERVVKTWIVAHQLSFGKVMAPLRLVLVGAMKGPHVFDILELIGKEACLLRINTAISALG